MRIKQETLEDKAQLENVVRPETRKLRAKLDDLYTTICEMITDNENIPQE